MTRRVPRYVRKNLQVGTKNMMEEVEVIRYRMRELLLYEESAHEELAEEMDMPPPWDDELRRFGEFTKEEVYQPEPQMEYIALKGLFNV